MSTSVQAMQVATSAVAVDPVTFEILKHRLWQINDEQGTTLKRVSGSPVASEVQDFNVGIADPSGRLVVTGMHLLAHVTGLSEVISNCMKIVGLENIRAGDMFVTNDPWMGAVHQNDVAVVAPLHQDGVLVGWTGSVIHQSDVGGPVPGSWNLRATDTFQEAPRYRFLRIVSEGSIAGEVMATLTTNSRFPHLVELDLRAQIAAANVVRDRMAQLYERYGVSTVGSVMSACLDNTETMLRRRLRSIPDGEFFAESAVDHDGHEDTLTTVRLHFAKRGERLIFDFRESDPQARGLINCTASTLRSAPFAAVLIYLCDGLPWNEGVMRCIDIQSNPGTVVDCDFPAAVASGIVNAGWAALNASTLAIAKLLLRSPEHRANAMAVWAGAPFGVNIFGTTAGGARFGTLLGLSGLQGAGARSFADGYDVAGYIHSPRCGAMNVETAEGNFPVLHLCRRMARDSGGPGRYRGGLGVEVAITPHGAGHFEVVTTSFGSDQSGSEGIAGGMPGGGANAIVIREAGTLDSVRRAGLDEWLAQLPQRGEALPSKSQFVLGGGDVLLAVTHGGGGFGDPLDRAPEAVARDVADGLVSAHWADQAYGVLLDASGQADTQFTSLMRDRRREVRRRDGQLSLVVPPRTSAPWSLEGQDGGAHQAAYLDMPLGMAGPWIARRWAGSSRRFRLCMAIDSVSGQALDCTQHAYAQEEKQ